MKPQSTIGHAIGARLFSRLEELLDRPPTADEVVIATVASVAAARATLQFLIEHEHLQRPQALHSLLDQFETGKFVAPDEMRAPA